jgi:hypothetical protein
MIATAADAHKSMKRITKEISVGSKHQYYADGIICRCDMKRESRRYADGITCRCNMKQVFRRYADGKSYVCGMKKILEETGGRTN